MFVIRVVLCCDYKIGRVRALLVAAGAAEEATLAREAAASVTRGIIHTADSRVIRWYLGAPLSGSYNTQHTQVWSGIECFTRGSRFLPVLFPRVVYDFGIEM